MIPLDRRRISKVIPARRITGDIPLAARCLERGARVVAPNGKVFTAESIGEALASRELMDHLRQNGGDHRRTRSLRRGRPVAIPLAAG